MVVGDQNVDSERLGVRHTLNACYAVINRDDEIGFRRALRTHVHDFGCKPVAELKAVRDDVVGGNPHEGEPLHRHGAGRCPVAVVVGNDDDAALLFPEVG